MHAMWQLFSKSGSGGGSLCTCPFQAQDPLAIQDKYVTYPGSFRPGQDKFRLALEVRGFPSPTRLDGIDNLDSQTGRTVQSSLKNLWHA